MSKNKIIFCDRSWFPVYYGFCPSEKAWKKFLKARNKVHKDDLHLPYPTSAGCCVSFRSEDERHRVCIVVLNEEQRKELNRNELYSLLLHEVVHIWQHIVEDIGEENPSPEFMAYTIQFLMNNILAAYDKCFREDE